MLLNPKPMQYLALLSSGCHSCMKRPYLGKGHALSMLLRPQLSHPTPMDEGAKESAARPLCVKRFQKVRTSPIEVSCRKRPTCPDSKYGSILNQSSLHRIAPTTPLTLKYSYVL
eukprot:1043496-Amphidinium_carterae.1